MKPPKPTKSSKPKRDWKIGQCYHVYQRGNHRKKVFRTLEQHFQYIFRLFQMAKRYKVRVHAYCLMENHVHFILEPLLKWGISNLMRDLQSYHSRWIHALGRTDGHSWKHHFGAKLLDRDHYRTALWYIEYNPVRAGMTQRAEDYPFSSAAAHCADRNLTLRARNRQFETGLYLDRWRTEFPAGRWSAWLRSPAEAALAQRIREVEAVMAGYRDPLPARRGYPPQQPPRILPTQERALVAGHPTVVPRR